MGTVQGGIGDADFGGPVTTLGASSDTVLALGPWHCSERNISDYNKLFLGPVLSMDS